MATYTQAEIAEMEEALQDAKNDNDAEMIEILEKALNQAYAQFTEKKSAAINFDRSKRGTKTPKTRKTVEVMCDIQIEKIVEQAQEIEELKAVIAENGFVRNSPGTRANNMRIARTKKPSVKNAKNALKQEKERVKRIIASGGKPTTKTQKQTDRQRQYVPMKTDRQTTRVAKNVPKTTSNASLPVKNAPVQAKKRLSKRIPGMAQRPVIRIDEQVKIIKSFTNLFVGIKTEKNLINLFGRIKKALVSKIIEPQSEYSAQVMDIQKYLHKALTSGGVATMDIPQDKTDLFLDIAQSEKVSLSVTYLNGYINLMKSQDKAKIANLAKRIEIALEKGAITENSYYYAEVKTALAKLKTGKIVLNPQGLSGLGNIINGTDDGLGCLCNGNMNGLGNIDADELSGAQLYNASTQGIGFTNEWLELMGDPTHGFSAVVFGPPKAGKTIFNMLFADYLQTYFGNVLYVSIEEFASPTLAMKVQELGINPKITFRGDVNTNLNGFDFVFIDSATKGNISFEDVEAAKRMYPGVSFITILQVTKSGNFRGGQQWTHNTDVIIEVTEGWADANGRYGAGELDIFQLAAK